MIRINFRILNHIFLAKLKINIPFKIFNIYSMLIKNFISFIKESSVSEIESQHNSLGGYIEGLCNDEYIKMITNQYLSNTDSIISISNSVNVLDDLQKVELLRRVENYLSGKEGESDVSAIIDKTPLNESYGYGVLSTFFKCLTALGFKENQHEANDIPSEFLIYFKLSGVDSSKIESVFKRFKSLSSVTIDYSQPSVSLYFGIKCDGYFEYGYYYDNLIPIGSFKLNKSTFNSIKTSELKSTSGIKKILVPLSFLDILLMCKIKNEMDKFSPEYFDQKMTPKVSDRIISFGFYGYGKWNNGQIDIADVDKIKLDLKKFLSKYKWSEKVMININCSKFWTYIQIKLK